jgi:uncharacterized peroxidase-related enzyme
MDPMYLRDVENHEGSGMYAALIRQARESGMPIPQIRFLFAFKPAWTDHLARFTQQVMRGPSPLPPGMRELIAAFTSRRNECPFWLGSHAAVAAELLENQPLVQAVLDDYMSAPISEAERALFALIDKVVTDSTQIRQGDIDLAKAAGNDEETIYDAITVCSLFQFYNTWIDATGVHDLPATSYEAMGKRMAKGGYAPE